MKRILALAALFAATLSAAFTTVNPSPNEPDLSEMLDLAYGSGNYYRIDDSLDAFLPPVDSFVTIGGYSASANTFSVIGDAGCITTTLSFTANHCTDPALNAGGVDYAVSFGLFADPLVRVIAFEDWPLGVENPGGAFTDMDFNDLVVAVRLSEDIPSVPEPPTAALLMIGFGALFIVGGVKGVRDARRQRAYEKRLEKFCGRG